MNLLSARRLLQHRESNSALQDPPEAWNLNHPPGLSACEMAVPYYKPQAPKLSTDFCETGRQQFTQFYAAMEKPTVHLPAFSWYLELMSLLFSYLAAEVKGCAAHTLKKQNKKTWDHLNKEKKLAQGVVGRKVHLTSVTDEASPAFRRRVPLLLRLCEHRRTLGEGLLS